LYRIIILADGQVCMWATATWMMFLVATHRCNNKMWKIVWLFVERALWFVFVVAVPETTDIYYFTAM
jgi:hypothetical protein